MAAYVSILRKLISQSFYDWALPKSNLKSESAPVYEQCFFFLYSLLWNENMVKYYNTTKGRFGHLKI